MALSDQKLSLITSRYGFERYDSLILDIIQPVSPSLGRFSKKFERILGKRQLKNFQTYLVGLCLELKRKNIQAIQSYRVKENYDSLHHFLSQSPWDEEKLNGERLKFIQRDRRTSTSQKGSYAKKLVVRC